MTPTSGRPTAAVAISAFLLTALDNVTAPLFAAIGIIATLLQLRKSPTVDRRRDLSIGVALLLITTFTALAVGYPSLPFADTTSQNVWIAMFVLLVGLQLLWTRSGRIRIQQVALVLMLFGLAAIGGKLILDSQAFPMHSDVTAFHNSAADELGAGRNPFRYAQTLNADPYVQPGTVITGYPYPPLTMAPLAASAALLGDSRWILLFAWLVSLGILGRLAIGNGGAGFHSVLILGLLPTFRVMLFMGWTEFLTIGLASMLMLLRGRTRLQMSLRAALFSAFTVSKQYFAFLAPMALSLRVGGGPMVLGPLTLLVVTILPYMLLDPPALLDAMYGNLAAIGQRPDSFSISGMIASLGIGNGTLSRPIWLALIGLFGLIVGRRLNDLGDLVIGASATLAFAFVTGIAFINYWMLCAALVAIGATLKEQTAAEANELPTAASETVQAEIR